MSKKTIIFSIIGVGLILLMVKNCTDSNKIDKNGVYVIGIIEDVRAASHGRHGYLSYTFKGRVFKTDLVTNELYMNDKGKRIFLKIDRNAPKKFRFQWNIPVPDSIQLSPYGGWDSLPVPFYQIPIEY